MRRNSRLRGDALVKSNEGEQGFWPSYADMMSAVALILFFLMLLSYVQNLITGNDLRNTQDVLEETRETLSVTIHQVEDAQEELGRITLDLGEARDTLASQQEEIRRQETELSGQAALLGEQEALLGEQESLLAEREALIQQQETRLSAAATRLESQEKQLFSQASLIKEQEAYLAAAQSELKNMRSEMQSIAVLRLSILEQIRDNMAKTMGDASKVRIGDNGSIILNEGVFFDTGSSKIKQEAVPALNQLIKVFEAFLSDEENAKYVDSIVISGHTDSDGSDESNLVLSTDRANAVLNYLLYSNGSDLKQYSGYFCAAGYGETRPVADNGTPAGRSQNRRIEISIILKDDTIMDIVEDYLKLDLPESGAAQTP